MDSSGLGRRPHVVEIRAVLEQGSPAALVEHLERLLDRLSRVTGADRVLLAMPAISYAPFPGTSEQGVLLRWTGVFAEDANDALAQVASVLHNLTKPSPDLRSAAVHASVYIEND